MDDYEVLEEYGDGRLFVRIRSGEYRGYSLLLVPPTMPCRAADRRWRPGGGTMQRMDNPGTPDERSERLLISLLDPHQRRSWASSRCFDVGTRYGVVELGRYHDLPFRATSGAEFRLCVVPTSDDMPIADVWVNLLLTLRRNPRWFLTVANWRRPHEAQWHPGPVPLLPHTSQG